MFFEDHPWLLIPIIIATVETWNMAKVTARSVIASRRRSPERPR